MPENLAVRQLRLMQSLMGEKLIRPEVFSLWAMFAAIQTTAMPVA